MCDEFFGKTLVITDEVEYIGEGEDPKDDPAFQIWEKALRVLNSENSNILT